MSRHEYEQARLIEQQDYPFYSLVMAAMRKADPDNLRLLQRAFPATWYELDQRYHSPGGMLPAEYAAERDAAAHRARHDANLASVTYLPEPRDADFQP